MDGSNKSSNFIKILYNLKNKAQNPFDHSKCLKLSSDPPIKIINYFGTYEDLFGEVRCPICLARVKSAKRPIDCRHIFCSFCINKWIKQSPFCPICRKPIGAIVDVDIKEKWVTFQGDLFA